MRLRLGEGRVGNSSLQNLGYAMKDVVAKGSANGRWADLRQGESGQTTVAITLFMATFLFGFIAVGIDVEALFHAKRQAQAAADGAAIAAAEESGNTTNEANAAAAVAKMNGFDTGAALNPATVTIHQVPTSGNYTTATSGAYLEVIVSQPVRTFFAGVITHKATVVIAARAVAAPGLTSPTCVCLEGPTGTDLNLSNNAHYSPNGCGTTVNSNSQAAVTVQGSASLGGLSIGSISTNWDAAGNNNVGNGGSIATGTKVVMGLSSGCSVTMPAVPAYNSAQCTGDPSGSFQGGQSFSVGPSSGNGTTQTGGLICYNSLTVGDNNKAVKLLPGIYVINGGTLEFESGANGSSNTGGNGVTFYLTGNAKLQIDNGANVVLTAPSSGTYAGIMVLEDPGDSTVPRAADTQMVSVAGGANASFNGAIFAPAANVNLSNGSNSTINADIVASSLTMTGGTTLSSTPTSNLGTYNTSTAKLAE